MKDNPAFFQNTVSSKGQLIEDDSITYYPKDAAALRVLFVGNSITLHSPLESIGWSNYCGMAASAPEKDYVHCVVRGLEKAYGPVSYCIAHIGNWEREYDREDILSCYEQVQNFQADIVIVRVGENTRDSDELMIRRHCHAHYDHMVKFFTQNAAKKVVTGLFWEREVLERILEKVAKDNNCIFVPLAHLGARDDCKALGEYAHHGVALHPNDNGMRQIADEILNVLI